MKNNLWKILIVTGTMLILSALFLCLYNYRESEQSYARAADVMERLIDEIPDPPAQTMPYIPEGVPENPFAEPAETAPAEQETVITIDGNDYIGYLSIPKLNISLPVMAQWSYDALKTAPCRYSGTVKDGDLILCAHNYVSHFGPIRRLSSGDEILFTECSGEVYRFVVSYTEEIGGYDIARMLDADAEDWDLTLFTCTLGGQTRVTVRAERAEA